jgi:hypothetical protein
MTQTKTATFKVPGASLYYEVTGAGPILLIIPGAPADADAFAAIAGQLADRYTVVTYDWRGSSRSPLDQPPGDLPDGLPMQVQGDDAGHLLAALADGPAAPASRRAGPVKPGAGPPDAGHGADAPGDGGRNGPDAGQLPVPLRPPAANRHRPRPRHCRLAGGLVAHRGGGRGCLRRQMPHLAALALTDRLGITPVGFPGDHQGFATHPGPFADTVHKALRAS